MRHLIGLVSAGFLSVVVAAAAPAAQTTTAADGHLRTARGAAQKDFTDIFDTTCGLVRPEVVIDKNAVSTTVASNRASWYAEPAKVFDNLYFVGQSEYSAWALTTSDGIIVFDAIFEYSVEDEVVGGLTKLGLDPKQVKYVIVSHGHGDHVGGAKTLQDLGAKIVMSLQDWDLLDRSNVAFAKPKRDVVAVDGQKLTLGDTTITLYLTPGHTLGTLSFLLPVKDGARTHTAAYWGGTAFNWINPASPSRATYITPERPARFWFDAYAKSASRFRDVVVRGNVDVILSNHTKYDRTMEKVAALRARPPGQAHPFVVGTSSVQRFLTVAEECALAGM